VFFSTREAAGALGIRHSLRPLLRVACALCYRRDNVDAKLGRYSRRENAEV
jgi:hypothetical protein